MLNHTVKSVIPTSRRHVKHFTVASPPPNRHEYGNRGYLAAPSMPEPDTIHKNIGVFPLKRRLATGFHALEYLLFEIADGAWTDPPPSGLR